MASFVGHSGLRSARRVSSSRPGAFLNSAPKSMVTRKPIQTSAQLSPSIWQLRKDIAEAVKEAIGERRHPTTMARVDGGPYPVQDSSEADGEGQKHTSTAK
jgi:hypothetical protein